MSVLDFFSQKPGSPDEHAAQPGAANAAPNSAAPVTSSVGQNPGDVSLAQRVAAREETNQLLQASPRRRGRPPKNAAAGGGNNQALPATLTPEMQAEMQRAVNAVYEPKAWGAMLAMPGDAMATLTGKERWELSKDERETLGITGSAFAHAMMITNPRGLAILMLSSALFSAYIPRATMEMREWLDSKRKQKAAEAASKHAPAA